MMYGRYASVYDGSGQVRFALLFAQYLNEVIQRHPMTGGRVLDMACGTGTLALILADEGRHVLGVDASEAMLAQAQAKAANADLAGRVAFMHGDMRDLCGLVPPGLFDLVTCTYDSLNYLLREADLLSCLRSVAYVLRDNGLFVGDMNTRYFLEYDWGSYEVQEQSGYVQISHSVFEPATATVTMHLTGFVGDDEHGYERFDEAHQERAYPNDTVAALIAQAGLELEAVYDCFTFDPPSERSQRVAWVARKHAHRQP